MANYKKDTLVTVAKMLCQAPDIKDFTPEQLAALHVFKHEFLASGYRLYERISPEKANPILVKYFKAVSDELTGGGGPP